MEILFVCTGNICRSPMGEAMLLHMLRARGVEGVRVLSAGTWGLDGEAATHAALEELESRGIDARAHSARTLSGEQLDSADLVIAMTSVHLREIADLDPEALTKTVLLKEIPSLEGGSAGSPSERLDALLAVSRPKWVRAMDVDDPMGLPAYAYRRTADELEAGISHLVEVIWPADTGLSPNP